MCNFLAAAVVCHLIDGIMVLTPIGVLWSLGKMYISLIFTVLSFGIHFLIHCSLCSFGPYFLQIAIPWLIILS